MRDGTAGAVRADRAAPKEPRGASIPVRCAAYPAWVGTRADVWRMRFIRLVAADDARIDLALGCLLIAGHAHPELDPAVPLAQLDALAARVDAAAATDESAALAALHRVLYDEAGFSGARLDYYDPRNALLDDVITRRVGIPITLAVVELEVARRAGIGLYGIGFPGHFLVGTPSGGLIDPFDGGHERTPDELRLMLRHGAAGAPEAGAGMTPAADAPFPMALLRPATNRQILARVLNNLRGMYAGRHEWLSALWAAELVLVLHPRDRHIQRDRAMLLGYAGHYGAATRALEDYLAEHRDAPDRDTVHRALALFRGRLD